MKKRRKNNLLTRQGTKQIHRKDRVESLSFSYLTINMKKIYLLVGIFLVVSPSFAISTEDIDEQLDYCYKLMENKSWDSLFQESDQVYQYSKTINYSWGKANSQFLKGWARSKQNELSEALLLYLESLRIMQNEMKESENSFMKASLHLNIGKIYRNYSNYDGANKFYEEGLKIAEENNHERLVSKFIYNQGIVYKYSGELALAAEKFYHAKLISEERKDSRSYFNSINQLGLINKDLLRFDSARFYFNSALEIVDELKNPKRYEAMVYHNIANTYSLEASFEMSEKYFLMSLRAQPRFISYKDLAEMYLKQNQYSKAKLIAEEGIKYYDQEERSTENAAIFKTLAKASVNINSNDADKYFDLYAIEIDKYLETREYTKKLEDAYQIDLLTKQYFLKLEQQKRQAQIIQLSWFFGIVVFAFILLFFAQRWYQKRKKADATDAIKAIFNQSEILRGSLDREL